MAHGHRQLVQGSQDKGDEALMAMMGQIVDLLARQDDGSGAEDNKGDGRPGITLSEPPRRRIHSASSTCVV